jgi:hypothetical protein
MSVSVSDRCRWIVRSLHPAPVNGCMCGKREWSLVWVLCPLTPVSIAVGNQRAWRKLKGRGWPFHILDALLQVLRCLRLCTLHVFISFRKINLCGVQLSALIFCLSNKGSPTERSKTERRMTECRKTQHRMTECRMTERRMTEHRMTKCRKRPNVEWLNAEWTERRKWHVFLHITFIYIKHWLELPLLHIMITIRLG